MSSVSRVLLRRPEDLRKAINEICDYLAKCEEKVYIVNRNINGKEEDGNFYNAITIDEFRNMDEIVGVVDVESEEYSLSLTSISCSYFKKN